jgi:peptide/nickel transport system substrate-binding protein
MYLRREGNVMQRHSAVEAERISRREALAILSGAASGWALSEPAALLRPGVARAAATRPLRMAYASDIFTTNPIMHTDTTTNVVLAQMYEPLVRMGRNGKWEGALAKRWEIANDTTVRFRLYSGIRFHNGDPLTSEDVKFTLDRIRDPAVKSPAAPLFEELDSVTADDPLTVTIRTKHPYAPLFTMLVGAPVLPAKHFRQLGEAGFVRAPIGTGAYRFKEWVKDVRVVMEAFPGYWRSAPAISGYTYRPIPEDAARLGALENDEVDLIRPLPVDQVAVLKGRSDLRVANRPGQQIYCGLNTLTFAPFKDRRVRQAVNHGVNVDSIVKNLFLGLAVRLNGPFFTVTPGYAAAIPAYPYSPDKAKRLLAEAGYAKGFDVTLTVPASIQGAQKFPEVGQAIAGDLNRIGVRAKLVQVEPATGFDQYRARKLEMYMFPWQSSPESGRHIETLFASYTRGYYYKSAEADALIKPYMATLDPQQRAAVGQKLMHLLHDDAPWLFLYQEPDLYGVRASVRWEPNKYDYFVYVDEMKLSS